VESTVDGVRFTLPRPTSTFLDQASIGLLPANAVGSLRGRALLESDMNMRPIGTGPFRVTNAELRRIQLAAFDGYWDRAPYLTDVEFRFVGNPDAALGALRRGEVTAVRPLPARDATSLPPGAIAYPRPDLSRTLSLVFNAGAAPLDDAATRVALARAVDRARV